MQVKKTSGETTLREDLLNKYPYALVVADEITIIAKIKGISEIEAFETSPFKMLLENK